MDEERELTRDMKDRILSFFKRQLGFKLDEIEALYKTDEDLVTGYTLALRVVKAKIDANDDSLFPDDVFGEAPSDGRKLDEYEVRELDFLNRQETARQTSIAEQRKKFEEMREKLKKIIDERASQPSENAASEAENGGTDLVSKEEIEAALKALSDEPDL